MLNHQASAVTNRFSWPKAFIMSLLATSFCVIVLGVVFLPREIDRLQSSQTTRDDICVPLPDGNSIFSLVSNAWSMDSDRGNDGNLRWYMADPSIVCFATYPDSQTGIYCRSAHDENTSQLMEFKMQTGEVDPILLSITAKIKRIAISSNGQFLAGIVDNGQVILLHRHSAQESSSAAPRYGLET